MVRTQVSLEQDMYERAKEEARRRGISFAELVRRCLGQALGPRDEDQPWMRFAGAVESGDPDASTTVDDVVYGGETTRSREGS